MNPTPRLDRLSALLGGLAPRVEVMRPGRDHGALHFPAEASRGLWLHLVLAGSVEVRSADQRLTQAEAPAMVICRADAAHALTQHDHTTQPQGATTPEALLCARAHLEGPVAPLLMAEFHQPMVVPLAGADGSLQQVIQLVSAEINEPRCGQPLLLDRAGDIVFIGLLRHLVAHAGDGQGLFHGLADPRLASTLVALHSEPQADWRLESMAEHAGMSRTAFANRFREALNTTPGKYLAQLRLAIAQKAVAGGDSLKAAARRTGYADASALSRALAKARAPARA
jgi:AraC-like DNA-binding protein